MIRTAIDNHGVCNVVEVSDIVFNMDVAGTLCRSEAHLNRIVVTCDILKRVACDRSFAFAIDLHITDFIPRGGGRESEGDRISTIDEDRGRRGRDGSVALRYNGNCMLLARIR